MVENRTHKDIIHEVCENLTDHPRIDPSQIEIEILEGCVHLRGHVTGRLEKREAERCVEQVPGVRDVINQLQF